MCIRDRRGVLEENGVSISSVAAIGVANQRETVLVWDRYTGRPVYLSLIHI